MENSQTHRLLLNPTTNAWEPFPVWLVDEVEGLKDFVRFLYPPGGQDRWRLLRPDLHSLEWVVWDQLQRVTYASGVTPIEAVVRAIRRRQEEISPTKL